MTTQNAGIVPASRLKTTPPPGRPTAGHAAFVDASGMAWTQISGSMSRIAVDTNGFKKPNQYGKDRFGFYVLGIHN